MAIGGGLFREGVIERMAAPEQLDELMHLTRPGAWVALLGLGSILLAALIWSVVGTLPVSLDGHGILLRSGGVKIVRSTVTGRVSKLLVHGLQSDTSGAESEGEIVKEDQDVVQVQVRTTPGGVTAPEQTFAEVMVNTPFPGQVVDIIANPGEMVQAGDPLMRLESTDPTLSVIAYLPLSSSKDIRPGMKVEVTPARLQRETNGFMEGVVEYVAKYSSDSSSINRLVGDEDLAKFLTGKNSSEPPVQVTIKMLRSADGKHYVWSTGQVPDYEPVAGALAAIKIVVRTTRPLDLLFPRKPAR